MDLMISESFLTITAYPVVLMGTQMLKVITARNVVSPVQRVHNQLPLVQVVFKSTGYLEIHV